MIRYTELKLTNRQDLRQVLPLAKPFTVLLEPSSLCNFRCVQCFQSLADDGYFQKTRMHMPLERFARVMEQLRTWPGPRIKVLKLALYGEPLGNPAFGAMLRLAREAEVAERMEITTNAALLSRRLAEVLVAERLDYVRVSIYGVDPVRHRAVTGSAFDVGTIHENLRVLQQVKRTAASERPFVSVKMLDAYGPENDRFMERYRDVADELYLDKPHDWVGGADEAFVRRYYGGNAAAALKDLAGDRSPREACPMPFTTLAVRSNGDVAPCCVDYPGGTNLGSVEAHSLQEIWHSPAWRAFQELQLTNRRRENRSCATCQIVHSSHYTRDNIDGFSVERLRRPAAVPARSQP